MIEKEVLPIFALLFMCIAVVLIVYSVRVERFEFAAINLVLFSVNAGLFAKLVSNLRGQEK